MKIGPSVGQRLIRCGREIIRTEMISCFPDKPTVNTCIPNYCIFNKFLTYRHSTSFNEQAYKYMGKSHHLHTEQYE